MARVRTVSVRVTAEVSDLEKKLAGVQKTLKKTGKKFKDVGAGIGKAFTVPVLAAGAAAFKFIQDASDMGETQAKIGELFDQSAGKIDSWSDTAATAFGQSKQQAMDAAATFAIFGKSAGLGGDDLVGFSTELTGLASDLASFNNTSPEEAINAIGSALRGEAEPMRKFGVLLDDASLRNEALKMGLIETTKDALTPQQKVLAAHALILAQTTTAQGDFARTSGGLANQQRILAAQFKDTSAELGEALLPLAMELMTVFRESVMPAIQGVVEWFKKLSPQTIKIAAIIGLVLAVVGPLIIGLGFVISSISTLIPVLVALTGPIGLVILAIAALIAITVLVVKNWDTIKEFFIGLWEKVKDIFWNSVEYLKQLFLDYHPIGLVIKHWDTIKEFFSGLWDKVKEIFLSTWEGLKQLFLDYHPIGLIFKHWDEITKFFSDLWDGVKKIFSDTWDSIKNKTKSAWDSIVDVMRGPINMILGFANTIIGAYEKMLNGVAKVINQIPSFTVPDIVPKFGGMTFGIPDIPKITLPRIPKLETGTNFVPKDMLAMLHKGEAVVPKEFNPSAGEDQMIHTTINIDGRKVAQATSRPQNDLLDRRKFGQGVPI